MYKTYWYVSAYKAHRVRGRNTENLIVELDHKIANYQAKRYVVMKFIHDEEHIVFNDIGKGRRKKEVYDGIEIIIAMN
jgi:hypothetical protein